MSNSKKWTVVISENGSGETKAYKCEATPNETSYWYENGDSEVSIEVCDSEEEADNMVALHKGETTCF